VRAGKQTLYWDTAVWLAWLLDERHWPSGVLAGIQDVVIEVESGKTILFTSTMTRTEIFQGTLTPDQKTKYAQLLRRSNMQEIAPDSRITDRASAIREYHNGRGVKISTPDAVHLATAIIYRADEFHTMDGLQKGGTKKPRKIMALNGNVAGYPLVIVQPYPRNSPPGQLRGITGPLFPKP
jgi:hypothetical protein